MDASVQLSRKFSSEVRQSIPGTSIQQCVTFGWDLDVNYSMIAHDLRERHTAGSSQDDLLYGLSL